MKKLMSLFILTSIIFVASSSTAVAQEVKERAKVELQVIKTIKLQRAAKANLNVNAEKKAHLKARPVSKKVKIRKLPIQRRIEK